MGQQHVSNIALIHIERAYANFVLENDIERIIDIFRSVVALAETVISSSLIELPYAHGRGFKGAQGARAQASHQQRASHQTRHILFVVHASCLQNWLTHSLQKTEDILILNP